MATYEINYKSDFTLVMGFTLAGVAVPLPVGNFRIVFRTQEYGTEYECSRINGEYVNCKDNGNDTLLCIFDRHGLRPGALRGEVFDYIPDSTFPDGSQLVVTPSLFDIVLVEGAGNTSEGVTAEVVISVEEVVEQARAAARAAENAAESANAAAGSASDAAGRANDAAAAATEAAADIDEKIATKQDRLVSGTNIKTINGESLLGAGNIDIQGGGGEQVQSDWTEADTDNPAYIKHKPTLAAVATSGSYNDLSNKPIIPVVPTNVSAFTNDASYATTSEVATAVATKQDLLVSGTNIKAVNNQSLLGSGNITIPAGADGKGIASIAKTGTSGLVDTYTITYTDGTTSTYTVTNGAQGQQGNSGYTGAAGELEVVNNLTDGGATAALSAEMGKVLGDVLVNDTKDFTSQMKAGYVMSGTANVGETITLTETANANGHYIILDVVAGDKVWLKGSGYAGNRQYIFMDDNNVVKEIAAWNKTADTDWTEYTTPNDATKLVVNSIDASNYGVKIQNTPMTEKVSKIEGKMTDIYSPLQLAGEYSSEDCIAGYIAQGNNGAAVSIVENSSRRYIKLDIKKGDKIRVNVVPNGVATYIVTDSNDVILYQGTKPHTPFDSVLDITRDDAAHIYCNSTYNIIVQRYTLPTQGEYNEVIDNVVSHLDMVAAENLYDGEVAYYGNVGGLIPGIWTSPISVEAGEAYTCYMIMGTYKHVGFWNGDTYVSKRAIQNGVNHITVPSGCNAMRFYDMDSKHSKECYVVKGSVDITHALRKKAAGYIDEFDLAQLTNKINLPLADKNIAILGDSITNVGYYPAEFFRITGYKNKAVYGRDGAAWTNDEYHTDNNIKERIDALENGITWTPDIIIVALGRNDNGRSPIGDVCEALWADQTTIDARATMYNAIRYGVKRLRSLYPDAKIFLQGIQWSRIKASSVINTEEKYRQQDNYVLQYNEVIRNAADHMGCSFINVFADGVCEDTADRYLSDGLHDNAAGGVVHGRCVAAAVLAAYKD